MKHLSLVDLVVAEYESVSTRQPGLPASWYTATWLWLSPQLDSESVSRARQNRAQSLTPRAARHSGCQRAGSRATHCSPNSQCPASTREKRRLRGPRHRDLPARRPTAGTGECQIKPRYEILSCRMRMLSGMETTARNAPFPQAYLEVENIVPVAVVALPTPPEVRVRAPASAAWARSREKQFPYYNASPSRTV